MKVTVTNTNETRSTAAAEVVEELKATGALDELFSRIDAGNIELTGDGGLVPMLIKETLERGLQAEMTWRPPGLRSRRPGSQAHPEREERLLSEDRRHGGR